MKDSELEDSELEDSDLEETVFREYGCCVEASEDDEQHPLFGAYCALSIVCFEKRESKASKGCLMSVDLRGH